MNEPQLDGSLDRKQQEEIFRALAESSIYHDFAENFSRTTGLLVSLTPVESWQLAHHGLPHESPFSALLAKHSHACAACLQTQQRVATPGPQTARTVKCVHGLCETAVPVRIGKHLLGFLRTGQVFHQTPTRERFERVVKWLAGRSVTIGDAKLRKAYLGTRVMEPAQYHSAVGLLDFLAQHLAILSNQIFLQRVRRETPMIASAKKFIEANYDQEISLRRVAEAVHTSPFNFCKKFKQATGINFSGYVSRLRVEKAKNLLLNPNYRISEIAYAVGFGSLTHFYHRFTKLTGFNATDYRKQLGAWQNGSGRNGSAGHNPFGDWRDPQGPQRKERRSDRSGKVNADTLPVSTKMPEVITVRELNLSKNIPCRRL